MPMNMCKTTRSAIVEMHLGFLGEPGPVSGQMNKHHRAYDTICDIIYDITAAISAITVGQCWVTSPHGIP